MLQPAVAHLHTHDLSAPATLKDSSAPQNSTSRRPSGWPSRGLFALRQVAEPIDRGQRITAFYSSNHYGAVRELANPAPPEAPMLTLAGVPDLKVYDSLLTGSRLLAGVR